MSNSNKTTAETKSNIPDANHEPLSVLVGTWKTEASNPGKPGEMVHGTVTFEWLSGACYLIERGTVEHPDFPDSISVIGYDEAAGTFTQHYFDSRGVERIYGMSVKDGDWKLWRDSPGFSQRFTGTISDNNSAIRGRWERSADGSNWEHDFDLNYRKSE